MITNTFCPKKELLSKITRKILIFNIEKLKLFISVLIWQLIYEIKAIVCLIHPYYALTR